MDDRIQGREVGGVHDDGRPLWLAQHRVTVPARVNGYLDRPALIERCMPTARWLTVLRAPGGFGKTTLLAECCRRAATDGVPVVWLSLDDQDTPAALEHYLAYAFEKAGLDLAGAVRQNERNSRLPNERVAVLVQALGAHGGPWLLALDELERAADRRSVALLNQLVRGLPGVHVAMTCRELPLGLDIAKPVLDGDGLILTAENLRFSQSDIARFFEGRLSRRDLAAVVADSAGWPIALRLRRNTGSRPARENDRVVRDVVESWVESRLWFGLSDDERDFLLDVGLLDWIDAELLDEVLSGTDLMRRLDSMAGVAGLFEPVRGGAHKAWCLHPLIREHCAARRRREAPQRYRSVHRRVAVVLARRGETVTAMRHAAEASDAALVGQIMSDAGGLRLWLRYGAHQLLAADRYLTDEVLAAYPRLLLARVVAQALKGDLAQAWRTFEAATGDGPAATDIEFETQRCLAGGLLLVNGCESIGSERTRALVVELARLAELPGLEPLLRGATEYAICVAHNLRAEFDVALDHGDRARRWLGTRSPYLAMVIDYQYGQIDMAQGRVNDAMRWYASGMRAARRNFLDTDLAVVGEVLTQELNLERGTVTGDGEAGSAPRELWRRTVQFAPHAAATAAVAELTLEARGADAALKVLDEMWEDAHGAELGSLVRYLDALRVAVLAATGRVDEAGRWWRDSALPVSHAACVDLDSQSWREMEALSCARLRLHVARGEFDDGRRLARSVLGVAAQRGLQRTRMRAVALAMALEESAGDRAAAMGHLATFLEMYMETGYALGVMRVRESAVRVLRAFLEADQHSSQRTAAEKLLSAAKAAAVIRAPKLSEREAQVLARLDTHTDREIATALELTPHGVRYHIRGLFAKLNARGRREAVRRAVSLGLIPQA